MLTGENQVKTDTLKDLIIVTRRGEIQKKTQKRSMLPSILAILILLMGIGGWIDLFMAAFGGIIILYLFKVLNLNTLSKSIDLDLLMILICSLAIGVALTNSGAAGILVEGILEVSESVGIMMSISLLFLITLVLTSLITNAAAVSIMFPIAMEMGLQLEQPLTPFFVAIAFAASGDFMTPIGYQTNLMIMGPGNYKFKDYFGIGLPLTFIYTAIVLVFIKMYYLS